METVVPGRGPAGSAYRYTWDNQGEVRKTEKIPKDRSQTRNITTSSSGRYTIPWPFQSAPGPSSPTTTAPLSNSLPSRRRPGSAPWSAMARPVSSMLDLDIIPDYVVNFLRGETPETLARKRERRRRYGAQSPRLHHVRNEQSCTADFYFAGAGDDSLAGEKGRNSPRLVMSLMTGWRGGVALNVLLAFLILAAAIVCLILAATSARMLGGETELLKGECGRMRGANQGIHAAVNVLGFVLIAGANYVSQVLSSPTRAEVDTAHEQQRWLDIGIPSFRNLKSVSMGRAVLAVGILLVAVSSQVIYNAITLTKQSTGTDASPCTLTLNGSLLGVITILNLVSVLALALALTRRPSFEPLVTLGDAVASFLVRPDQFTRGACLLSKSEVRSRRWDLDDPRHWCPRNHRWAQTPSGTRWIIWAVTWAAPVALTGAALGITLTDESKNAFASFGGANSTYPFSFKAPSAALAIIVSLPHLLLAVLYLTTNALLTVFSLSHELSLFAIPGSAIPLRVSTGEPIGAQTTSLYLTLPRPFSWLLFLLFAAMGFMLSQAVVLVSQPGGSGYALGLSPLPLVVLWALLVLVGALVAGLCLRRAEASGAVSDGEAEAAGNPLVLRGGSCSAVLSARCHRTEEGEYMVMLPLGWGVVREGTAGPGHATFSSRPTGMLNSGRAYV